MTNLSDLALHGLLGGDGGIPVDIIEQTFNVSGTWTKPDNAVLVVIEMWAGGGGGSFKRDVVGYGGGGGEYARVAILADNIDSTVPVSVGAGGIAGPSSGAIEEPGGDGGDSEFGGYLIARGGPAGLAKSWYIITPGAGNVDREFLRYINLNNRVPLIAKPLVAGGCAGWYYGEDLILPQPTFYGGGGGGGGYKGGSYNNSWPACPGGISDFGGNGGQGGRASLWDNGAHAGHGAIPGGGGGGGAEDDTNGRSPANAGNGGRGRVIVTTYTGALS